MIMILYSTNVNVIFMTSTERIRKTKTIVNTYSPKLHTMQ